VSGDERSGRVAGAALPGSAPRLGYPHADRLHADRLRKASEHPTSVADDDIDGRLCRRRCAAPPESTGIDRIDRSRRRSESTGLHEVS
jgi:hypothetical protein